MMDTSKQYVEMCEKAREIQGEWKPKEGDNYIYKIYLDGRFGDDFSPAIWWVTRTAGLDSGYIWLPRQDQLQEIVGNHKEVMDFTACYFWALSQGYDGDMDLTCEYLHSFTSMEQVWLAFAMKKSYNKEWVNGGWNES